MAIREENEFKTVSVYDPAKDAYFEISLEGYKKMLESLKLTPEEIEERVEEIMQDKVEKLKGLGLDEESIKRLLKL